MIGTELNEFNFITGRLNEGWTEKNINGSARVLFSPNKKTVLRLEGDDYAFEAFANLSERNPENPYFPNILGRTTLRDFTRVTWMERLIRPPNKGWIENVNSKNKAITDIFNLLTFTHEVNIEKTTVLQDEKLTEALKLLFKTIDDSQHTNEPLDFALDTELLVRPNSFQPVLYDMYEESSGIDVKAAQEKAYKEGDRQYADELILRKAIGYEYHG